MAQSKSLVEYGFVSFTRSHFKTAGYRLFEQVAQQFIDHQPAYCLVKEPSKYSVERPISHIALGAPSGMPGVEQMVLGQILKRERQNTHPMAHVYLEDREGRWWFGAQALMITVWSPMNWRSQSRKDGKPPG